MVRSDADDDCAFIAGDGEYAIEIVSESRHQERLEWLGQGRGEEPVDYECTAVLTYEPDNPRIADAVSVAINGVRVGYLPADAAAGMIAAMQTWRFDRATCDAIIEGGWYRSADDKGDFSVRLDIGPDFTPAALPVTHVAPPVPVAVPSPTRRRNTAYDLIFGAAATVAMLVLAGVVWLVVEQSREQGTQERHALARSLQSSGLAPRRGTEQAAAEMRAQPNSDNAQAIGARAAMPDSARDNVKPVAAGSEQPSLSPAQLAESSPRQRGTVIEAGANAAALSPLKTAPALTPASRDAAAHAPPRASQVNVAKVRQIPAPAGSSVERLSSAGTVAPQVAEEIHPMISGKPPIAAAQATVDQVGPLSVAALSSSRPKLVLRLAAHSAVPSKPAPGTEWVNVIPLPRPNLDTADTADSGESNVKPVVQEPRQSRARARSQREAGTRTTTRLRNGTRYRRSKRRTVRYQYQRPASSPPPPQASPPPGVAGGPALPPAARLFQAWTNDVQSVMRGPRPQP